MAKFLLTPKSKVTLSILGGFAGAAACAGFVATTLMNDTKSEGDALYDSLDDDFEELEDEEDDDEGETRLLSDEVDASDALSTNEVVSGPVMTATGKDSTPIFPQPKETNTSLSSSGSHGKGQSQRVNTPHAHKPHPRGHAADAAANDGISWGMTSGAIGFIF